MNPVEHLFHVAVDAWLPLPGTANTPTHHPSQMPFRGTEACQRTPTVPLGFIRSQESNIMIDDARNRPGCNLTWIQFKRYHTVITLQMPISDIPLLCIDHNWNRWLPGRRLLSLPRNLHRSSFGLRPCHTLWDWSTQTGLSEGRWPFEVKGKPYLMTEQTQYTFECQQ